MSLVYIRSREYGTKVGSLILSSFFVSLGVVENRFCCSPELITTSGRTWDFPFVFSSCILYVHGSVHCVTCVFQVIDNSSFPVWLVPN
jgi:hypothetical protein